MLKLHKTAFKGTSLKVKIILFQLCFAFTITQSTFVKNGAYENIVVEIKEEIVAATECSHFIKNLENFLKSSSERIYDSFSERISYGSFTIILPPQCECIENSTVNNYNGIAPDITITKTDQTVWTQQSSEECGEQGDQIFVDFESINNGDDIAEDFNLEFLKYRYGVYDVKGYENNSIYPPCTENGSNLAICAEIKKIEPFSSQGVFKNHNKYFPSKHNFVCSRNNPMDIILNHKDFDGNGRYELKVPTFNYVKKAKTRYMIVIDDTSSVSSERDSFAYLRDAFRKFIEKDLNQNTTEVGIYLLSENITKEDYNFIKPLNSVEAREEILGNFWYIDTKFGNLPKCMINMAVSRSINLLSERAKYKGDAINVILLIAPGMFKCGDEQTDKLVADANKENIKIVTLNYPALSTGRIPLDQLAYKTGGKAFTVLEKKQNEQQSLLSTFFELTNTLMHLSSTYATVNQPMPIEIYRKELVDTASREDNRPTFDSFTVDPAYESFKFFVYIYDRRERNIEKGMKLISPNNVEFSTLSELRAEYHQIEVLGNFTGSGSWTYSLKRFHGYPQPNFIQVLAYPKPGSQNVVTARSWIKKSSMNGLFIVFTELKMGKSPIIDASVEAVVTTPTSHFTLKLFDVSKSDGIYKRYLTASEIGLHKIEILTNDNGMTSYIQKGKESISSVSKQTVPTFQRFQLPISLFVNTEDIDYDQRYLTRIGKVEDLKIQNYSDGTKLVVEFTEPDMALGNNRVQVNYNVRYSTNYATLVDYFDTLANEWVHANNTFGANSFAMSTSFVINLLDEPSLIGQVFYVAIKPFFVDKEIFGPLSNVVRVYVPEPRAAAKPPGNFGSSDEETDSSFDFPFKDESELFTNSKKVAGIQIEFLIVAICIIVALLITFCIICCRISRRKKSDKLKKTQLKSKQDPSLSVIVTSPFYNPPVPSRAPEPMNESLHGYMDHLTVGLPVDDEMMKTEYISQDQLFDEMIDQRNFQNQYFDTYGSRKGHNGNDTGLRWASDLLEEHEKRRSPMDFVDPTMMYLDANGDLSPRIPELPYVDNSYHSNYGYAPNYSAHRPLGSMQSVVSGAMNSDKKIRNITMV